MRLFVFLMIPLLASCLVEERDPEASDAKAFTAPPPKNNEWVGDIDNWVGGLFVIKGENNHTQPVIMLVNPDEEKGVIRAIDWDEKNKKIVSDGCIDRYDELVPEQFAITDGGSRSTWEKNGKSLHVVLRWKKGKPYISDMSFLPLNENGKPVIYYPDTKNPTTGILNDYVSGLNDAQKKQIKKAMLLEGDDCEHVSRPSGEGTNRPH